MHRSLYIKFSILIVLFAFSVANAQGLPVGTNSLEVSTSSNDPIPGQNVTLTAKSYSIDINSSNVTWSVDGKVVQKGIGMNEFQTTAPSLGKNKVITVSAITTTGLNFNSSFTLSSGSVDILLENNGYVPPFFAGKLPVSFQNSTNIIAMPHLADSKGVEYDPKTLVYQWKKNSRVVEDQSGYGKQTFALLGEIVPRATTLNVTVSTRDGKQRTSGFVTISYNSPSLNFYIDDPLYGPLWNKAVSENIFIGTQKETSVLMTPFGFNKPLNNLGNLVLTWMINGYERPELETNESITLRAPENSQGSSNIELTIKNKKDILQSASVGFSAYFSSQNDR